MRSRFITLLTAVTLGACGEQPPQTSEPQPQEFGSQDDAIFAGFDVNSKSLDAVGSLGLEFQGQYFPLCTATLVSEHAVLSAKHCAQGLFNLGPMYWAPGSENARTPSIKYRLVDVELGTPVTGGSIGIGADVAVFFADEVPAVEPIAVATAPLATEDLGRVFYAIGYGTQNNLQDMGIAPMTGTRKIGKLTLNAIDGKKFEQLFGTKEAFFENLEGLGLDVTQCLADPMCGPFVESLWAQSLFSPYEAFLGKRPGDAQVCHGDSGGPLIGTAVDAQTHATKRLIHGVASNVWFTAEQRCFGNFYATFGPKVQEMLGQAQTWVDPCGDLSETGSCSGTVATRCTSPGEGRRRISEVDCAPLGLACGVVENGTVACVDPVGATPAPMAAPDGPTIEALRTSFENAFYGLDLTEARLLGR